MSTLGDALVEAGFDRAEMDLGAAVTKFLKSGGTIAAAHAVVDTSAERMSGRGHTTTANDGRSALAPTRQPVEDGRATSRMFSGQENLAPPSSSNRGREGQGSHALQRQTGNAVPVREPSRTQRTVAGMIAKASAVTVLDTLKIDGRAIGDWTVAEARAAGKTKTREGWILIEASRVVANAPANALIRSVIKADELQIIMQNAAEISDAA
jgi:hypothetical protein